MTALTGGTRGETTRIRHGRRPSSRRSTRSRRNGDFFGRGSPSKSQSSWMVSMGGLARAPAKVRNWPAWTA
eukprot:12894135-Prorocentrum_lima.AAC.1